MCFISDLDKKYIDRQLVQDDRMEHALKMARARGEAAKKWLANNKLTKDTKPEFDALMKKVNNMFK